MIQFLIHLSEGTTALACLEMNRNFIGFELNKDYYNATKKRIKIYKNQIRLYE